MTGAMYRCVLQVTCPVCVTQEVLNGAGAEIQLAAAASFLTILQDDIILIHTHTYSILKIVLLHLNHRDTGKNLNFRRDNKKKRNPGLLGSFH